MTDKERIDNLESLVMELTSKLIITQSMVYAQHGAFNSFLNSAYPNFVELYQQDRIKHFNDLRPIIISRYKYLPEDLKLLLQSMKEIPTDGE